jgi:hypothetical protein
MQLHDEVTAGGARSIVLNVRLNKGAVSAVLVFGEFMRRFDLHHLDKDENAEWSALQLLMDRCETGAEGRPAFEIWEADDGPIIVEVALAAMDDTAAWILNRSRSGSTYFLAHGNCSEYYQCNYWGCPEYVRDCCLLSRSNAAHAIRALIEQQGLSGGWRWMPQLQAFDR